MPVVPHRFLFRYSFPVRYVAEIPRKRGKILDLPADCALTDLGELDSARPFAKIFAAWNEGGLGFAVEVSGKKQPPVGRLDAPEEADGLQLWIDTRNTQSIHRASRYCHHFCAMPAGAGKKGDQPIAVQIPIMRAREESTLAEPDQLTVSADRSIDGYRLEVWLPSDALYGYDPQANPLVGFSYLVRDAELGEHFLTVGRDFPIAHDPSLWSTLELRAKGK